MDTIEELRHLMAAHQFGLHSAEIIARQDNNDSEGTLACCLAVRLLESPDEILIISLTQRGFQIMENEQMQSSLQTKRTHYETLESLLMEISPRYGECFAQNLHRRLLAVQSERNALDDELQTQ